MVELGRTDGVGGLVDVKQGNGAWQNRCFDSIGKGWSGEVGKERAGRVSIALIGTQEVTIALVAEVGRVMIDGETTLLLI
jgi:hypothetical protein